MMVGTRKWYSATGFDLYTSIPILFLPIRGVSLEALESGRLVGDLGMLQFRWPCYLLKTKRKIFIAMVWVYHFQVPMSSEFDLVQIHLKLLMFQITQAG